jgi:hypothetical protein
MLAWGCFTAGVTLARMPYVICSNCSGLTYVPRSFRARAEPCPVCDTPLDASTVLPPAPYTAGPLDPKVTPAEGTVAVRKRSRDR